MHLQNVLLQPLELKVCILSLPMIIHGELSCGYYMQRHQIRTLSMFEHITEELVLILIYHIHSCRSFIITLPQGSTVEQKACEGIFKSKLDIIVFVFSSKVNGCIFSTDCRKKVFYKGRRLVVRIRR